MKKIFLFLILLSIISPCWGTTYYLDIAANNGSDSNDGLTPTQISAGHGPWLSTNHPVTCGDLVLAATGTSYVATNFINNWGTVSCAGANNVAWLKCNGNVGTCGITSGGIGMQINSSFWGVQGWLFSGLSTCLQINANSPGSPSAHTHHVIVANNICRDFGGNGFNTNDYMVVPGCDNNLMGPGPCAAFGVDYQTFIGNWVYHGTNGGGGGGCYAGFSLYEPMNSDTNSGTHIYEAGNLVNDITNNPCAAGNTMTYSGDAFLNDTFDGEQHFHSAAYSGQQVVENNFILYIGGRAFDAYDSYKVSSPHATQIVRHNTAYSVMNDPNQFNLGSSGQGACAPFTTRDSDNNLGPAPYAGLGGDTNVTFTKNLTQTTTSIGCQGSTIYDFFIERSTNVAVTDNWSLTSSTSYDHAALNNSGVTFTGNHNGTSPGFASPADPGAPPSNCNAYATVTACFTAAGVVANFTPSGGAVGYGYQVPGASAFDADFPQWLCTVTNIPAGLIQLGCAPASNPGTGAGMMR